MFAKSWILLKLCDFVVFGGLRVADGDQVSYVKWYINPAMHEIPGHINICTLAACTLQIFEFNYEEK